MQLLHLSAVENMKIIPAHITLALFCLTPVTDKAIKYSSVQQAFIYPFLYRFCFGSLVSE